jgi:cathepsin X
MKVISLGAVLGVASARINEVWNQKQTEAAGIVWRGNHTISPLPHETLKTEDLPDAYTWCNKDGVNYCTMSRNQHIPQYCGSCWAHGSVSALGDRVKIMRGAKGIDINLAVQHILNCGNVGSCHGGSVDGPYQWLHGISQSTGTGISYETSNPYLACSSESQEGLCPHGDFTCKPINVARTCSTFSPNGHCAGLSEYPNVTISEYGSISGADAMAKEIYARGPISCGIDAAPILNYTGGISSDPGEGVDHVISVVGWGKDSASDKQYWIVRNSWGEFWGEMGYIRVEKGNNALKLEEQCSWAVPKAYTAVNFPCYEGGENCETK